MHDSLSIPAASQEVHRQAMALSPGQRSNSIYKFVCFVGSFQHRPVTNWLPRQDGQSIDKCWHNFSQGTPRANGLGKRTRTQKFWFEGMGGQGGGEERSHDGAGARD